MQCQSRHKKRCHPLEKTCNCNTMHQSSGQGIVCPAAHTPQGRPVTSEVYGVANDCLPTYPSSTAERVGSMYSLSTGKIPKDRAVFRRVGVTDEVTEITTLHWSLFSCTGVRGRGLLCKGCPIAKINDIRQSNANS